MAEDSMAGVSLGTRLYTWLRGEEVGSDAFGNRYFREKNGGRVHPDSLRTERRWVIYDGQVEASRVPSDWHAWLHHTSDEIPPPGGLPKLAWQKEHVPNMTGTSAAYRPSGHTLAGGARAKGTGDYEAWTPD
jgi:NADH:ubiquinone oxidoreductase subunit